MPPSVCPSNPTGDSGPVAGPGVREGPRDTGKPRWSRAEDIVGPISLGLREQEGAVQPNFTRSWGAGPGRESNRRLMGGGARGASWRPGLRSLRRDPR